MTENESKYGKVAIVGGGRNAGRTLKQHIDLLEEIQAYRAIGTVEKCRVAVELMKQLNDRKMTTEVLENYMQFEDECVKMGYSFKSILEARERMKPKKPFQPFGTHSYKCSNCWKFVAHEVDDNCDLGSLAEWCPYCGSRIDWSE